MSNKVVQLKDPQGNNIYPISADDGNLTYVTAEGNIPSSNYALGTVLAYAQYNADTGQPPSANTNTLLTSGWGTGTLTNWSQFGPMKRTTEKWSITIQAPADEDWYIELEVLAPFAYCTTANAGAMLGICEVSGTTILHYLSATRSYMESGSNTCNTLETKQCLKISAGENRTFAIFASRYGNGSMSFYGNGWDQSQTEKCGCSILFKATLIDKEKI